MSNFVNEPLSGDRLPRLDDANFVAVDRNFLRVSLFGSGLFAVVVVIAGVVVSLVLPKNSWIPLLIAACLLLVTGVVAGLRVLEVRHIAYQVRSHDLSYRSGVLFKSVATVPFARVQHARIRQGPVQRRFDLATLEVNSAGPDLQIEGLSSDTAARLKMLVVERAGDLDEET